MPALNGLLQGFVDDYVYTVQACLDLYTATLSESWLQLALKLQEEQDRLFLDTEVGEHDGTGQSTVISGGWTFFWLFFYWSIVLGLEQNGNPEYMMV